MRKRVLVVDDDAGVRALLRQVLSEFDADIREATRDDLGYQEYVEFGPDLLLIDVLLPKNGGLELLRRIRNTRGGKDIPAFVMSAVYRSTDIRRKAVSELNALDFIKKPFNLDALHSRLARVLSPPQAQKEPAPMSVSEFAPARVMQEGKLESIGVPALLESMAERRITACAVVTCGEWKKTLYLSDGSITFASSNQLRETLGQFLLSRRQIGEGSYAAGVQVMRNEGKKLGAYLISEGILDSTVVLDAVRTNIQEKIMDIFTWGKGEFRFTDYQPPPAVLPGQPFEIRRLLWDGVRSKVPYEKLLRPFQPLSRFAVIPKQDLFTLANEISLEKEELQLLRFLKRSKGALVEEILAQNGQEHDLRFLYYLFLRGYLGVASTESGEKGLGVADSERIRRANRRLASMKSRNYFQLLRVGIGSSDDNIREAYFKLAKEVHPDMLGPNDPPELKRLHDEMFVMVQNAYEGLKTAPDRHHYLKDMEEHSSVNLMDANVILDAEALFRQGVGLFERRRWREALEMFKQANEINPDEGEYVLYLGICKYKQASSGSDETLLMDADRNLHRAAILMQSSPEPLYWLGKLWALRGEPERAAVFYKRALTTAPAHIESQRELRLINLRSKRKKPAVLGGLFRGRRKT